MTYHYTMCGLDYVYLENGFQRHETDYGEGVSIDRSDDLDRAIARLVVTATTRLRGQEVRFFRALLHWSQTELANELGVKRITVTRWEAAPATPIPGPADRLLRLVVARKLLCSHVADAVMEMLPEIADVCTIPLYMSLRYRGSEEQPSLFPNDNGGGEHDGWRLIKRA